MDFNSWMRDYFHKEHFNQEIDWLYFPHTRSVVAFDDRGLEVSYGWSGYFREKYLQQTLSRESTVEKKLDKIISLLESSK